MPVYGIVTRYPKPNEIVWNTQAFDSLEDPEGGFLYEFNEGNGWQQPIMTRKDMEFFQSRPNDYKVDNIVNRPSRPQRPTPEKPVDGGALMTEKRTVPPEPKPAPKPTQAPVEPTKPAVDKRTRSYKDSVKVPNLE